MSYPVLAVRFAEGGNAERAPYRAQQHRAAMGHRYGQAGPGSEEEVVSHPVVDQLV